MPLNWKEFSGADAYKALKPEEQDAARLRFFDDQVAPRFAPEKRDGALAEFNRRTMTPATIAKPAIAPASIQRPEANVAARAEAPAPQQAAMPVRPVRPGQVQPAAAQPVVAPSAVEQAPTLAAAAPPEGFRARRPSTMPTDMASTRPEDQNDWEITKGLKAGVAQTKALGYGLKALAGDALGMRDWERDGMSGYRREMEEAALHPGRVQKIEEINGLGDAVDWALYGAGTQIPTLASMVVTGGAAGAAYGLAAKGLTKKVAASLIEKNAAKLIAAGTARNAAYQAATKAVHATAAGVVGSMAGGAALEMPSIYGDTYDFDKNEGNAGVAATFGAVAGALEAIPGVAILKRMGLGKMATEEIAQGLLKDRTLGAVIDGMVREGATEGLQTIIERAAGAWVDENKEIFSSEGWSEIKNAMALGAMFGGGIEGGTQFIQNRMKTKPVQPGQPAGQPGAQPPADEMPSEEARTAAFGEADVPRGTEIPPEAFAQPEGAEAADTLATDENGDIIIEDGGEPTPLPDIQLGRTDAPIAGELYNEGDTTDPVTGARVPGVAPPTEQPITDAAAVAPPQEPQAVEPAPLAAPAENGSTLQGEMVEPLNPEARKQHMNAIGANLKVLRAEREAAKKAGDEALMAEVDDEIQATAVNFKRLANNQAPLPTPREQAAGSTQNLGQDPAQNLGQVPAMPEAPALEPAAARPKNDGIDLADEQPVKALDDERMQDPDFRNWMESAVGGLVSVKDGNLGLVVDPNFIKGESDRGDEVRMIRAGSVNPPWFQEIAAAENVSVDGLRGIVKKAMTGAKLGVRQDRAVRKLMDAITDERIGELQDWGRGLGMSAEEVAGLHNDNPVAHMRALEAEVSARQKKAADAEVEQQWAEQDAVVAGKKAFTPDVVLGEDAPDVDGYDFSDQEAIEGHVYATAVGWGVPVAQLDELHAQAPDAESFLSSVRNAIREIRSNEKIRSDQGEAGSVADIGGPGAPESGESAAAEAERLAGIEQARAEAIPALEEYLGTDWRKDNERRARLAAASPDELVEEVYRDKMTGLLNKRAWNEDVVKAGFEKQGRRSKPSTIAYIDLDGLKFLNDEMGHAAGDELLANFGAAMKAGGIDGYHISGDEFGAIFENEADASEAMDRLQWEVESSVVRGKSKDGRGITNTGIAFSYGLGGSANSADMAMQENKKAREAQGLRGGARGGMPSTAAYDSAPEAAGFDLAAETEDQRAARESSVAAAAAESERQQRAADAQAKKKSDAKADKHAADTSVDRFELGQSAEAQLKGQPDMLGAPSANTIFTEGAAAAARERLRAKFGRPQTGLDPESVMDGITLAGYHIEKGARTFSAYAKAMLADLGDAVRPYLKSWYVAISLDPRAAAFDGMDSYDAVKAVDVDAIASGPEVDPINTAAHEAATSPQNDLAHPTEAQIEAENHKMGHVLWNGLDMTIQFPAGTKRNPDWKTLNAHYGHLKRTEAADGEQVDVFINPDEARADKVVVIDQYRGGKKSGGYDEAKVMVGYPDKMAAINAYKGNYPDGWQVGPATEMSVDEFKAWLKDGGAAKPAVNTRPARTDQIGSSTPKESTETSAPLDMDGFLDGETPIVRSRAAVTLSKNVQNNGRVISRLALIREKVTAGSTVVVAKDGRRLQSADGAFLDEAAITKTGMDYAEHLIAARNLKAADPAQDAPTKTIKKGDRFTDAQGNTWEVWNARTSLIEAFPVVDGKIRVNNQDGQRWATDDRARFANPEARTDFMPIGKEGKGATPQLMSNAQFNSVIQIAADSIEKLRSVDVDRVISETPAPFRRDMAMRIKAARPDLADAVDEALAPVAEADPLAPTGDGEFDKLLQNRTIRYAMTRATMRENRGEYNGVPTVTRTWSAKVKLRGRSERDALPASKVLNRTLPDPLGEQTIATVTVRTGANVGDAMNAEIWVTRTEFDYQDGKSLPAAESPAWHTEVPTEGLPLTAEQKAGKGMAYESIPGIVAADAYDAITQVQKLGDGAMYLHVLPAEGGRNGIARLFPEDQKPPAPWVLAGSEAVRPAWLTREQAIARMAGMLRNAPIIGDAKAATAAKNPDRYPASPTGSVKNGYKITGGEGFSPDERIAHATKQRDLLAAELKALRSSAAIAPNTGSQFELRNSRANKAAGIAKNKALIAAWDEEIAKASAIKAKTAAAPAAEPKPADLLGGEQKPKTRIADFGERIEGAAKYRDRYTDQMAEAMEADIAAVPLSESWPEPDYEKMLEEGADPGIVAFVHAARDEIPVKPKKRWKVAGWTEAVRLLRDMSNGLINGSIPADKFRETLAKPEFMRVARDVGGRADLYQAVGHGVSLKGVTLRARSFSRLQPDNSWKEIRDWGVEREAKASAFGNWPQELGVGNTREEAIAAFKAKHAEMAGAEKPDAQTSFEIYRYRANPGVVVIGKKIGKDRVDLAQFPTLAEARAYLKDNHDALVAKLEAYKKIPRERRLTNEPRVGVNHRNGGNVTEEQFKETFGFRGGQFGSSLLSAQKEAQAHLNESYDALMDLAGVLGVPPKALSLNGELALAFAARGRGGVNAAAAHYERDTKGVVTDSTVVINLTRKHGAGSLAHEWFHALDNYFARARKERGGMLTERPFPRGEGVRPEMVAAFKNLMDTIKRTALEQRSMALDKRRTKIYWSTGLEMSARSFESYIIEKLRDQGASNDYLANIVSPEYWAAEEALRDFAQTGNMGEQQEQTYPYPTAAEIPAIRAAFDHFFQTIETKETDKGIAIQEGEGVYSVESRGKKYGDRASQPIDDLFGDPYENAEQRPGTTEKQRDLGRDALRDLSRRIGLDSVARRFNAGGSAPSILGAGLVRNFVAGQPNSLIGGTIQSPRDLAALAQVYRDPRFETFRIAYLKGDTVVGEAGYSSRMPGIVDMGNDFITDVSNDMARFGADGYYAMHNHPSGKSAPSTADENVTINLARKVPGFRGHVVIDHNEYSVLDASGWHKTIQDDKLGSADFRADPVVQSDLLGATVKGPRDVVDLAKRVQKPDMATVVMTVAGETGRVNLVVDLPADALRSHAPRMGALIRRMARGSGSGGNRFLVLPDGYPKAAFQHLITYGVFTDVVGADGTSSVEELPSLYDVFRRRDVLTKGLKGARVYEPEALYSRAAPNTDAFRKWFGDSKVVDAEGKPLVVYHGTNADVEAFNPARLGASVDNPTTKFGFYFTNDAADAASWADRAVERGRARPAQNVLPVYLAIKNPVRLSEADFHQYLRKARESTIDRHREKWEASGHDGIITTRAGKDWYIAFRPEQIKSATGNNGKFDPANPSILESRSTAPAAGHTEAALYERLRGLFGPKFMDRLFQSGRFRVIGMREAAAILGPDALLSSGDLLSGYDQTDIDQAAKDDAARKKQEAKDAAKVAADEQRDSFVLTGSNSEADKAAARGQGSLFSQAGTVRGFYDRRDGITYLISENIPQGFTDAQLKGLMRHEIGVHALKAGRDSAGWQKILGEIDRLIGSGDKAVHAAFLRAGAAGTRDVDLLEEVAGYLVEDAPDSSIARQIIAWFKNQIYKLTGFQMKLTDADIVAMARAALQSAPDQMREIAGRGLPMFSRRTVRQGRIRRTIDDLIAAAESQKDWRDWYKRHEDTLIDLFGNDADLFQKILSATSQIQTVPGNVTMALRAYEQYLSGAPFTGYLSGVIKNLERIRNDEAIRGPKIADFQTANAGDEGAMAVDRHIAMLLFNTTTPNARQIAAAKDRMRTVAARMNWTPRQVQAALWAYNQVRKGTDPAKVRSYDTILETRADFISALRSQYGRGEGGSVPAGGAAAARNQEGLGAQPAEVAGAMFSRALPVNSEAFRRWFGDSKVVDENGAPKVVYHGTGQNFSAFDPEADPRAWESDRGLFFFASSRKGASDYASIAAMEAAGYKGGAPGANVMPVYLSIRNPLIEETSGDPDARWDESGEALAWAAKELKHDGVIIRNAESGQSLYVAFKPTQIKSAIGNRGTFDSGNPDILFSRAQNPVQGALVPPAQPSVPPQQGTLNVQGGATGPGAQWTAPPTTPLGAFIDTMLYRYQDKHIDLKRTQQGIKAAGRQIGEAADAYLKEELFHGRAATRAKEFLEDELDPLVADMRARGVEQEDLGRYLWARHAQEANEHIAKINPELPDGGSGMLTQEAQDYLAALTPQQQADYAALAARVDAITQTTRNALVNDKLISAQQRQDWESAYQHYVPLFRELDANDDIASLMMQGAGTGQGYSIKGAESKRRTGSQLPVADILGNLANARDKAIVRGEKARVGRALYALALTNKNPDFWRTAVTAPTIKTHDKNGMVIEIPDPLFKQRDNVVVVKVPTRKGNIVERAVIFNERDPRAARMARAIKNLDGQQLGEFLGAAASVTRYFASINTQYNPIFGVVNLIRDVQTAMLNLSSTPLAGKQAAVAADMARIVAGAMKHGLRDFDGPWKAIAREFEEAGGMTGYRDMFRTGQERTEAIEKALDPNWWQKRPWGKVLTADGYLKAPAELMVDKGVRPVMEWLSDYNQALENATRLAAYKQARDMGLSKDASASIAKNLTVNFNRKGEMALQLGALYAFFNAATQGIARMGQTFAGPAGKYIVGGGVLAGVLQAMLLAAAGYDDDEPPQFVRERALILPTPWNKDRYVSIPMPLGFHVLPNFGRLMVEAMQTGDVMGKTASMMGIMADAFNPLGGSAPVAQILSPTATDPFVALGMNKDWTGKPISREDFSNLHPTPGFTRARDAAGAPARWLAKALNRLSGGTDYTQGLISPTPDQIEYLAGQLTGGIGREAIKASTTATSIVTGDELPMHKVPLIGRFYGSTEGQAPQANKFYANLKKLNEHGATVKGLRADRRNAEVMEYLRDNPDARLFEAAGKAERKVSELRARRRALAERDASKAELKRVDDLITAQMVQLNDRMKALSK